MEAYERQADNSWLLREANRLGAAVSLPGTGVTLPGTGVTLPLAEIYDRVEFPASTVPPRPRPPES